MIWNVLLVLVVAVFVAVSVAARRDWLDRPNRGKPYPYNPDWGFPQVSALLMFVATFVLLIVALVCVGSNATDVSVYRRSGELVDLKVRQRDALAALVQDELSIEQYEAVMAATPNADILVILGNNASTFLVEKTRLLVAINTELNSLVNGLARDRIELCAWADNPLSPRLFVAPVCPEPILLP